MIVDQEDTKHLIHLLHRFVGFFVLSFLLLYSQTFPPLCLKQNALCRVDDALNSLIYVMLEFLLFFSKLPIFNFFFNFFSQRTTLRTASTYLKMIQWLNVRAVGAIKASTFEGKRPSPPSSSVSSYSSPRFTSTSQPGLV